MSKEHITLRLDEDLLKKIDALAKTKHEDRTELIAELLAQGLAPAPAPVPAPGGQTDPPPVLKSRLDNLEQWRQKCAAEASKRERAFWLLTLPPLIINGGYGCGLFGKLGLAGAQSLALFISTLLLFVEKERPQNRLFTAFQKSSFELEQLIRAMTEQWEVGSAAGQDPNKLVVQILAVAEKEEDRVSKYIEDAESYLRGASLGKRFKSAAAKQFAALGFGPAAPQAEA